MLFCWSRTTVQIEKQDWEGQKKESKQLGM